MGWGHFYIENRPQKKNTKLVPTKLFANIIFKGTSGCVVLQDPLPHHWPLTPHSDNVSGHLIDENAPPPPMPTTCTILAFSVGIIPCKEF